jgi:ubiquinone/menaquinone biosynthesis C-methylase UbiE
LSKQNTPTPRLKQAIKISNVLFDIFGENIGTFSCLDIGCGSGEISQVIGKHVKEMIAIDLNADRFPQKGDQYSNGNPAYFFIADGSALPFNNQAFDLILCLQVYEHTAKQNELVKEIWRVLKPGGVCFFSGPNKFAIIEEHYWLPFLSWLPKSIANRYMRIFHRGLYYDILPLSYKRLRLLLRDFYILDANLRIIKNPNKFGISDRYKMLQIVQYMPTWLLQKLLWLVPNFNLLLTKKISYDNSH